MEPAELTRLTTEALYLALILSGPALLTSLVVGLSIGLVQAVTQVQEQTLSFVPKLIAVALILLFMGNWMMHETVTFTQTIIRDIPNYLQR